MDLAILSNDIGLQKSEVIRNKSDYKYFLNAYAKIVGKNEDGVATGIIPFKLFKYQRDSLDLVHNEEATIILKARQLGLSWILAGYALWMAMFHKYQRILIISINETEAKVFLEKVKFMFDNLPNWMKPSVFKRNEQTLWFGKRLGYDTDEVGGLNSRIDAIPSSKNAGTSRSLNLLIIDECAKIEWIRQIWKSAQPALAATGGHAVLNSTMTTEATGDFFEEIWHEADDCRNDFKQQFIPYFKFPGRNEAWLKSQARKLPLSERHKIKQEHPKTPEEAFQAMGGKYYDAEAVAWHKQNTLCDFKQKGYLVMMDGLVEIRDNEEGPIEIFEYPEPDEQYVLGGDPAEGIEKDNTALAILRKRDLKVCATFHSGTTSPEEVSSIADKLCRLYNNALAAVECNNNHGGILNILLKDVYFNVYYHDVVDRDQGKPTKRWGWLTTEPNRNWILDNLGMKLEDHSIQLSSTILYKEIFDYIINSRTGKGDHKKGKHDDMIFAVAIALWVIRENPWIDIKRLKSQQKVRPKRRPKGGW